MAGINKNLRVANDGKVTPYLNGDGTEQDQGWILFEETKTYAKRIGIVKTSLVTEKRTALFPGKVDTLKEYVNQGKKLGFKGRIVVTEFRESELPAYMLADDYTGDISRNVKVAGDTGVECTIEGERIYRFSFYDESGEQADTLIAHDNASEIRAVQVESRGVASNDMSQA